MLQTGKTVSILGCGWLGLPLGNHLAKSRYRINGSTTKPEKITLLQENNIAPFVFNLADESSLALLPFFLETDILIISFPPGIRAGKGESYLQQIKTLAQSIKNSFVKNIIFISSTSVYPDLNKIVTEKEDLSRQLPENPLLQAERIIQDTQPGSATIIRFSGLVGETRRPGRFFAGKMDVPNPLAPVNLIHLADCIPIIAEIIRQEKWGEIYNACTDAHPAREVFYTAAAQALDLVPPQFAPANATDSYKIISSEKLKNDLNYQFIYPDPLLFI